MSRTMPSSAGAVEPAVFAPRRLAHVNLWVRDQRTSLEFYRDVCGLRPVFDEPGIGAVFLSNGSSHHDLALMQTMAVDRVGRAGQVQIPASVGNHPGLNHLGFEMENEAALVRAHRAATVAGHRTRTVDHQISRSVYLHDPDRAYLEFYTDVQENWRMIYQRAENQLLTTDWQPGAEQPGAAPPDERPHYAVDPPVEYGTGHVRPRRTARAVLCVADLATSLAFHTGLLGLRLVHHDQVGASAVLTGTLGLPDVGLVERPEAVGLHHFGLELADDAELERGTARLAASGIPIVHEIDAPGKHGVVLRDPDGTLVEFFVAHPADKPFAPPTGLDPAFFV